MFLKNTLDFWLPSAHGKSVLKDEYIKMEALPEQSDKKESKMVSKEKENNLETEKSEKEQKGAKEYVKYYEEPL